MIMSQFPAPPHVDLAALRVDYSQRSLTETDIDADPVKTLQLWIDQAIAAEANEPNAMALATSHDNRPGVRMVLLKAVDSGGLSFFTNYHSRKAVELDANARAACVFWWPELQRQVRVEGMVKRTSPEESAAYFNSRPPMSRLGSAASPQSQVLASREELEKRFEDLQGQYPRGNIPCPAHWGGYRLTPHLIEFWQGRLSRMHDRIECTLDQQSGKWIFKRLAP